MFPIGREYLTISGAKIVDRFYYPAIKKDMEKPCMFSECQVKKMRRLLLGPGPGIFPLYLGIPPATLI